MLRRLGPRNEVEPLDGRLPQYQPVFMIDTRPLPYFCVWITDLWYVRGFLPAEAPGEAPHAEHAACSTSAVLGAATIKLTLPSAMRF